MKLSPLALAGLCLIASGCGDSTATRNTADSVQEGSANSADTQQALVSGFADPDLAGMTAKDHPQGAQIVSPPSARNAQPSPYGAPNKLHMLAPRAVLTAVNDTPVRNAAHFRDLMNAAFEKKEEISLGQLLFMEDSNNDGWVTLSASEPEPKPEPAKQ